MIPEQWRIGRTIPLYKKGDKTVGENYRPITNLCSLAKLFERAILSKLQEIEADQLVDLTGVNQHGFKKGRSTITAALSIKRNIVKALDQGKWSGLVSLDLSSAFDIINHKRLIERLQIIGLPQDLIKIVEIWLEKRTYYVEVNGKCSIPRNQIAGTIQGSVLGPVLFALYLSPLLQIEDLEVYADDNHMGMKTGTLTPCLHHSKKKLTEFKTG